jgi:hypothetical protein
MYRFGVGKCLEAEVVLRGRKRMQHLSARNLLAKIQIFTVDQKYYPNY